MKPEPEFSKSIPFLATPKPVFETQSIPKSKYNVYGKFRGKGDLVNHSNSRIKLI